jgi:hypothetical protein
VLRRAVAFIKEHAASAFTRGSDAAQWVWHRGCAKYKGLSKKEAAAAATVTVRPCELTCGDDELMGFLSGFVVGHLRSPDADVTAVEAELTAPQLRVRNLYEMILRARFKDLSLPLIVKKSVSMLFNGASWKVWQLRNKLRETYSKKHTEKLCKALQPYSSPLGFEPCTWVRLIVKDNKEFWFNLKHVRVVDGVRQESMVYHTVTGEHIPLPRNSFEDLDPAQHHSVWLPIEQQVDLLNHFPIKRTSIDATLQRVFNKKIQIAGTDPILLLERPAPETDLWTGGRQVTHHEPIHLDVGTSSLSDVRKVIVDLIERFTEGLLCVVGDQQTHKNAWTVVCTDPKKFERVLLFPGELHGHMHCVHSIFTMHWTYILEPICLILGVTKVHVSAFHAKEHSEKQRLIFLIFSAGLKYMRAIGVTDEDFADMPKFLEAIGDNLPGYDFIHFLFYCCNHYVEEEVNATRTNDSDYSDFSWQFNMNLFSATGKRNYKQLCILFGQVRSPDIP